MLEGSIPCMDGEGTSACLMQAWGAFGSKLQIAVVGSGFRVVAS